MEKKQRGEEKGREEKEGEEKGGKEQGGKEEGGNRGGKAHSGSLWMFIRLCEVRAGVCLPGAKGIVEHRGGRNGASSSQNELGRGQSDKQRGVAVKEADPEGLAGEQHRSHCAGSRLRKGQGQLLPGWEPPATAAVQGDVPGAPGTQTAANRAGASAVINVLEECWWCSTAPVRRRLMPAEEESGISLEQMKCRGHTQDKRAKQESHSPSHAPLRAAWSRGKLGKSHWKSHSWSCVVPSHS